LNMKLIALCGMGVFALLAIIGALWMLLGRGSAPATPVTASDSAVKVDAGAPTTAAGPKPLALAALNPLKLEPGGKTTVELRVERNGNDGPIQVQVAGAPQGVTATAAEIPAGQSVGQLAVAAADSTGELTGKVDVTIKVGQAQSTQSVTVTVSKVNLPAFQPVEGIVIQPGTTAALKLTLARN